MLKTGKDTRVWHLEHIWAITSASCFSQCPNTKLCSVERNDPPPPQHDHLRSHLVSRYHEADRQCEFWKLENVKPIYLCLSQVRQMQSITRTSTTVLSPPWSMTGGWRFIKAQGGRPLLTSHLDLFKYAQLWDLKLFISLTKTQNYFTLKSSRLTALPHVPFQLATYKENSTDASFPEIRWHQTADVGFVPNYRMKKTFMAVALDLPDKTSPYGT